MTDLVEDLNSLITQRARNALQVLQSRGGIAGQAGTGTFKAPDATSSSGGIASPLKETTKVVEGKTVPDREYWPGGLTSSDGLFILPAIKTLNMTDANRAKVQIQLANPSQTVEGATS